MPSVRSTVLAVAATLVAVAQADYVIDPDSVPLSQRQAWCASEKYTCPLICQQTGDGSTKVNECDPKSLTYGCICGNGQQPNVSEYSLSLPYFVCSEWGNQCVTACDGSNTCASACREDHPCGAQDPKKYNTTATATGTGVLATASATDDADTIYTDVVDGDDDSDDDSSDSSSSSSDKSGSATALEAGRKWGLAVVMGSMFVGFALL
ncbi:hypothetical protein G7Z17_g6585 [Cylindrodendrum hubeiense]|uniref:DUF7707 domain-containing protein n=1 Tax=Cylindrodendrum hubeiense TaxID=595255 RepID=A0A9P5LGN2_9HYPO|nr:hypothetical protein G7Z17_g6585 [Cylindrodendrum hubeiense]